MPTCVVICSIVPFLFVAGNQSGVDSLGGEQPQHRGRPQRDQRHEDHATQYGKDPLGHFVTLDQAEHLGHERAVEEAAEHRVRQYAGDSSAENGKLIPAAGVTVPNSAKPEREPVREVPFFPARVTWSPVTEPCSWIMLPWPGVRSAAAFRPLTATATATSLPLLRPAYRARSGAFAVWAPPAVLVAAVLVAAVLVADFPATVLAHRKITAKTTTVASVIRGPRLRLLIPGYRP
jgi:hypothetical protein